MNKRIQLNDGNIILINVTEGYACNTVSISKNYIKDEEFSKSIEFTIWDDISFNTFVDDVKSDSVEFEFDINDPLYFSINRFLGDDNEIVIDDDDTAKSFEKYMTIKRENNIFKIIFVNKNDKNKWDLHKFSVFIKNIGPDHRSKIIDDSFKLRIVRFFRDMEKTLLEQYHQITLDENAILMTYDVSKKKVLRK